MVGDSTVTACLLLTIIYMKVQLYKYTGNTNTVNKKLNTPVEVDGKLYSTSDVMTPTVTLRTTAPFLYNYVYIPTFKRYYFVDNISYISGYKAEINLSVDVLKSYESEIMSASASVRKTDNPDKYASNRETVYNRKPKFEKVPFANTGLLNENGGIIMITLKGTTEN